LHVIEKENINTLSGDGELMLLHDGPDGGGIF